MLCVRLGDLSVLSALSLLLPLKFLDRCPGVSPGWLVIRGLSLLFVCYIRSVLPFCCFARFLFLLESPDTRRALFWAFFLLLFLVHVPCCCFCSVRLSGCCFSFSGVAVFLLLFLLSACVAVLLCCVLSWGCMGGSVFLLSPLA